MYFSAVLLFYLHVVLNAFFNVREQQYSRNGGFGFTILF